MTVIPLNEWLPDLPAHNNPGLVTCTNLLPVSRTHYAPVPKMVTASGQVTDRVRGAYTSRDSAGNVAVFAGYGGTLAKLTAASSAWDDVTWSTGAYSSLLEQTWRFVQYGEVVIATNFTDPVQSYDLTSSTDFAELSVDAPRARHLAIWNNFLVLGNTENDTQEVRWSAIDDPTSFPAVGSSAAKEVQSDQQILAGDGGWITALTGGIGNAVGLVFQERALWSVNYVGSPLVFTFDQVEGARGTTIPNSVIHYGSIVAYWGGDGFYIYDGVSSKPIGNEKVDQYFLDDFNRDQVGLLSATADPERKLFLWCYMGTENTSFRILVYNWSIGRWSLIKRIGTSDHPPEWLFQSSSLGYTVDTADNSGVDMEHNTLSPDDRFWTGGAPVLAAFYRIQPVFFPYRASLAFFSGTNMPAELETGELDLSEGRRVLVQGIRPIIDTDSITASIGYRSKQSESVSYTTASSPADDGFCPQRIDTRYPRAKLEIAEDVIWTKFSAYEPKFKPTGTR